MSIEITDTGYDRLLQTIHEWQDSDVEVGVFDADLAMRTVAIEYGTDRAPARPFLGPTMEGEAFLDRVENLTAGIVDGSLQSKSFHEAVGGALLAATIEEIDRGDTVPNAPSTIARKGSAKPRVDSGAMRAAVKVRIRRP